jgi:hypothetical protein
VSLEELPAETRQDAGVRRRSKVLARVKKGCEEGKRLGFVEAADVVKLK